MNTILFILQPLLLSLFLSSLIIPRILVVSYRKKLFDYPDERKVHQTAIPRLGGFSFLPSILFAFLFTIGVRYLTGYEIPAGSLGFVVPELLFLICGLILLYLAGLKDDLVGLRYRSKFAIQIIAAGLLPMSGLWINNLYGILGIHALSPWIGIPFTILVVVFIINAMNLIDGLDGLASGLSGISLLIMGLLFYIHNLWVYAILAFATLGAIVPFFLYNVFGKAEHCKKIFMGDTGSLILGYMLAFLIIRYSACHPEVKPCSANTLVIAFSTLLVPVFDVFRVILVRARNHKHLFIADKNHIHHKLLTVGLTPRKAMVSILLMAICFYGMNLLLLLWLDINLLLAVDVIGYTGLNMLINKVRDKRNSPVLLVDLEKKEA